MLWSVELFAWVHKRVELHADSVGVEVLDVQDFELCHEWFGVGPWREVLDEAYYTLLCSDQWSEVGAIGVVCAPDGDLANEVGEHLAVVELSHGLSG